MPLSFKSNKRGNIVVPHTKIKLDIQQQKKKAKQTATKMYPRSKVKAFAVQKQSLLGKVYY